MIVAIATIHDYYLNGTVLLGRNKVIEVVLILSEDGIAVGNIMSVMAGAATNKVSVIT